MKYCLGWSVHLHHFIHLWVLSAPLNSICSSSLMTVRPSGLACGPNTFYREPHFTSSQEQSSTLRMVSLSSVSRPEISLLALIQALNLLLARNFQSLGGVTLCFPGSWFHSEFNEGAERPEKGFPAWHLIRRVQALTCPC